MGSTPTRATIFSFFMKKRVDYVSCIAWLIYVGLRVFLQGAVQRNTFEGENFPVSVQSENFAEKTFVDSSGPIITYTGGATKSSGCNHSTL